MVWLLWQKPVGQELSEQLKERLIEAFDLDPETVDKMRYSGKKGHYSNRPVKYIRIYDPSLLVNKGLDTPAYDGLDRKSVNRCAVLFDGRIEANEQIHLADQRVPSALFPLS